MYKIYKILIKNELLFSGVINQALLTDVRSLLIAVQRPIPQPTLLPTFYLNSRKASSLPASLFWVRLLFPSLPHLLCVPFPSHRFTPHRVYVIAHRCSRACGRYAPFSASTTMMTMLWWTRVTLLVLPGVVYTHNQPTKQQQQHQYRCCW